MFLGLLIASSCGVWTDILYMFVLSGSNLLIDNKGTLKLADFGLARFFANDDKGNLTNRVISLWYRYVIDLVNDVFFFLSISFLCCILYLSIFL